MITRDSLTRTFFLRYGGATGTAFTLDIGGRQYLITAAHVVRDFPEQGCVEIQRQGQWQTLKCTRVGLGAGACDVAVLSPSHPLWSPFPLEPATEGMMLGQDMYFLGFPYGLSMPMGVENSEFPFPLIKRGCLSALSSLGPNGPVVMFLDGHNNPGFSGGPVLFAKGGQGPANQVAGVISGYLSEWKTVIVNGQTTPAQTQENSGIVQVVAITHALDLIRANPIGVVLPRAAAVAAA